MSRRSCAVLLALSVFLPDAGRAADKPYRASPDYPERMATIHSVAIVVSDLKSYELMVNDKPVFRDDWTDRSRENVSAALERALRARGLEVRRLQPDATEGPLQEATLLYEAVVAAVVQATYLFDFPTQKERFDYTLGDLGDAVDPAVDALVFVWGRGVNSSGGRKAFQLLLGSGSFGIDRLAVALVARDGQLLWFDAIASTGYDLRDVDSATRFVETATSQLPKVAP